MMPDLLASLGALNVELQALFWSRVSVVLSNWVPFHTGCLQMRSCRECPNGKYAWSTGEPDSMSHLGHESNVAGQQVLKLPFV